MEEFLKSWKGIMSILTVIITVLGYVYLQGGESKSLEGKTFDSPEQKVEVITKVKELPSTEQTIGKHLRDSMDTVNRIKSRNTRDSLMLIESKARRKTDSTVQLNADQLFQIKELIKEKHKNDN